MTDIVSYSGQLYAVGKGNDKLYTINTTTGVASIIGDVTQFGVGESLVSGLAYHNTSGMVWDGVQTGAEQNVQSDWNQADEDADDFIKNKPVISGGSGDITSSEFESLIKAAFQIRSNPFTRNFVATLSSTAGEAKLFTGQTAKFGATQYLALDKDNKAHQIDLDQSCGLHLHRAWYSASDGSGSRS